MTGKRKLKSFSGWVYNYHKTYEVDILPIRSLKICHSASHHETVTKGILDGGLADGRSWGQIKCRENLEL